MQKKSWLHYWTPVATGMLMVTMLTACSETAKRQAGRNLRQDVAQARQLHQKASGLLVNPQIEGENVVLLAEPDQAIELLDEAERILKQSLAENFENVRSESGNGAEVSKTDAAMAYYVRGLVHELAGDYYAWKANRDIRTARQAIRQADALLTDIQKVNAVSLSHQPQSDGESVLRDFIQAAEKQQSEAAKAVAELDAKIQAAQDRIAQRQKQVEDDSFAAARLRTESEQMDTAEGREKLNEAWAYEEKIHKANEEIEATEKQIAQLKGQRAVAQSMLATAEDKLSELREQRQHWQQRQQGSSEQLSKQQRRIQALSEELLDALEQAGKAASVARGLVGQADGRLQLAATYLTRAAKLAPESKQAQVALAQGDVKVAIGENQMDLKYLRKNLSDLTDRIDSVWQALSAGAPSKPSAASLQDFVDNTKDAVDIAATNYAEGVEHIRTAVRKADRKQRWTYQHRLAGCYLNYAEVLVAGERTSDAVTALDSAAETIEEAIDTAPDPRVPEMQQLQDAIQRHLSRLNTTANASN